MLFVPTTLENGVDRKCDEEKRGEANNYCEERNGAILLDCVLPANDVRF
jgi:hypothetical protein